MSKKSLLTLHIACIFLCTVLFGILLNFTVRNKEHYRVDLGGGAITTLGKKTTETLTNLTSPIKITYYASERGRMPTSMKGVESEVRALLREMSLHGGKNFSYEAVYAEDNPQVIRSLGRFRITSFQITSILNDEYRVNTAWSGLLIEYKGQSRAIPYITAGHLDNLEEKIISCVTGIETGYKPSAAVSAPDDFNGMRAQIQNMVGEVKNFHSGSNANFPSDADIAFIIQPENATKGDIENVKAFLSDGKDVFVCFSNYEIKQDSDGRFIYKPRKSGFEEYLADIGIKQDSRILLEKEHYRGARYMPEILNSQVVLEGFKLERTGNMLLPHCSPIVADIPKLKKNGYSCDTLVFGSKDSWTIPSPEKETVMPSSAFDPAPGIKAETVAVVLTSNKPWEGRLFLFSSGLMFGDWAASMGAGQLYFKNILMTFANPEKLSSLHISREHAPLITEQTAVSRILWRAAVVFAIPLLGIIMLFIKISPRGIILRQYDLRLLLVLSAGGALILLFAITIKALTIFSMDITRENVNSLNPVTLQWMKIFKDNVTVTYFTSPPSSMPLSLNEMARDVTAKLERLSRESGGHITVKIKDASNADAKETLERYSIKPFKMKIIENDRYIEKMVYSALLFENNTVFPSLVKEGTEGSLPDQKNSPLPLFTKEGRFASEKDTKIEVIPVLSRQNSTRLEFIVVSALKRLAGGSRPSIAFIADLPHLTAGEFWELQQLEVQIMPRSENVYSRLISILRNDGYNVNVYDSAGKESFSEDMIIYIQPWVVSEHIKSEINRYLNSGKSVLIAAQHYKMQARKYSGLAYEVAYWPQPQFSRINDLLEPYGVELVNEIFFDQSKASIDTSEQIRWGAYRRQEKRAPDAQPFIIRAVPENYDKDSAITSRLSDLLFIWGNRWRMVKGKFPADLSWRPLISSSPDCWKFNWKGGFLTQDILTKGDYLDAAQPLVVMVEGNGQSALKGKLFLIGSSKLFENEQIDATQYDNEKFILNTAADLAYGSGLAQIQSGGNTRSKGFPFVSRAQKMLWRIFVLCFVPVILLIYAVSRKKRE